MIEFEVSFSTNGVPTFLNVYSVEEISTLRHVMGEICFSPSAGQYLFYPTLEQEFGYEPYDMGIIGKKVLDLTEEYRATQENVPF